MTGTCSITPEYAFAYSYAYLQQQHQISLSFWSMGGIGWASLSWRPSIDLVPIRACFTALAPSEFRSRQDETNKVGRPHAQHCREEGTTQLGHETYTHRLISEYHHAYVSRTYYNNLPGRQGKRQLGKDSCEFSDRTEHCTALYATVSTQQSGYV